MRFEHGRTEALERANAATGWRGAGVWLVVALALAACALAADLISDAAQHCMPPPTRGQPIDATP